MLNCLFPVTFSQTKVITDNLILPLMACMFALVSLTITKHSAVTLTNN